MAALQAMLDWLWPIADVAAVAVLVLIMTVYLLLLFRLAAHMGQLERRHAHHRRNAQRGW